MQPKAQLLTFDSLFFSSWEIHVCKLVDGKKLASVSSRENYLMMTINSVIIKEMVINLPFFDEFFFFRLGMEADICWIGRRRDLWSASWKRACRSCQCWKLPLCAAGKCLWSYLKNCLLKYYCCLRLLKKKKNREKTWQTIIILLSKLFKLHECMKGKKKCFVLPFAWMHIKCQQSPICNLDSSQDFTPERTSTTVGKPGISFSVLTMCTRSIKDAKS